MRVRRTLVITALAVAIVGCGEGDEPEDIAPAFAGSCQQLLDGTCTDYTGSLYIRAVVEQACPDDFSEEPCPDLDRVGGCLLSGDTEEEQEWSFYAPEYSTESAEAVCNATENASWLGL